MPMRTLSLRLSGDLLRRLQDIARWEERNLSSVVRSMLIRALMETEK